MYRYEPPILVPKYQIKFCVVISTLGYYMQMKDDPKFVEAPVICQEKHQLAEKLLLL